MAKVSFKHHGKPTYEGALADQAMFRVIRHVLNELIRKNLRTRKRGNCTLIYNGLGWDFKQPKLPEGGTAVVIPFRTRTNARVVPVQTYG
jgi:hypothetical protein